MPNFKLGETVICWRNVKDPDTGQYYDPATSMKISIFDPVNGAEISNQDMVKDNTGKYHCNYNSPATALRGDYKIVYTATDGSDIAIWHDTFKLE